VSDGTLIPNFIRFFTPKRDAITAGIQNIAAALPHIESYIRKFLPENVKKPPYQSSFCW
jgi:hypothetical protein